MIYLTVNDAPSGVYKSQVIDVLHQINTNTSKPVRLIAFVSVRNFKSNKKTILNWYPNSTILPMFPGIQRWELTKYILRLRFPFIRYQTCIARNVMAYAISKQHFKTVIYDGRGAIGAELTEFPDMIPIPSIVDSIKMWERKAVLESDFRIAVSQKLVEHWQDQFQYSGQKHIVIPCTVNVPDQNDAIKTKAEILVELGWSHEDIIIVYSGGIAGWQSFDRLMKIIPNWINRQDVKVLFLTKNCPEIDQLTQSFPNHVKRLWLKPEAVLAYTSIADYGLLIRRQNITNQVASPVKFAEYLMAGLKVIISEEIGDFTDFVSQQNCGHIFSELINDTHSFVKVSTTDKARHKTLAIKHFSKPAFNEAYLKLLTIK